MQRSELHIFLVLLIASWHLIACSSSNNTNEGVEYNVEITFDTDSTVVTDNLYLFVDNHRNILQDTLSLNKNRTARYSGTTVGTDELFLLSDNGNEICHFYATAGGNIQINISGKEDSLIFDYSSPTDTINGWLQQYYINKPLWSGDRDLASQAQHTLDSLKECGENGLRTTLLVRHYMPYLLDSIYVRQYMGGIAESGKPDWLIKSIDGQYPKLRTKSDLGRLTAAQFNMHDTLICINTNSRSDYMLLYFWGDYSQQSVDSLSALSKRIQKDYSDRRLMFLTFCLSAPDSTWWNNNIKDLPIGHHALISGGMADSRIANWPVNQVPYTLYTDMFTNIQNRNVWNEELETILRRIPRRTSFSSSAPKILRK